MNDGLNGQAIVSISAAVVGLTQLVKWGGLPDRWGPVAVLGLALVGTIFWGWSHAALSRATAFDYFAGWVAVATSAAGIFGFTRAAGTAVSTLTTPPSGAGASPTIKG